MAWRPGSVSSQKLPGNLFQRLFSSEANCVASKGGDIIHAHDIIHKRVNCRDASLVRVRELLSMFFETNLYLFPNSSMSNSLIKTSAIKTFPKILSLKTFFGKLRYIVVIPIPKSKEFNTKEPQNVCLAVVRQVHAFATATSSWLASLPHARSPKCTYCTYHARTTTISIIGLYTEFACLHVLRD